MNSPTSFSPNPAYEQQEAHLPWPKTLARAIKYRLVQRQLKRLLPYHATIADLGCGPGRFKSDDQRTIIGFDASLGACHSARQSCTAVAQADHLWLPLKNASVNAVIASYIFEHVNSAPQAAALAAECARVVKTNGFVVVLVPDALREGMAQWDRDYTHNFVTTARRMKQLLGAVGFELLLSQQILLCFSGASRLISWWLWLPLHLVCQTLWTLLALPGLPPSRIPDHSLLIIGRKKN
jgi:SAM-dependent methyltransferase